MLGDTAIVILNYMTYKDTKEMLESLKNYYSDVKTVIVDNGSSGYVVENLLDYAKLYQNVTVLPLKRNMGFARGMNFGIKHLRDMGYNFICCSNSDIIIPEKGILESLKRNLVSNRAAIAGPRIIGMEKWKDQNPLRINRPDPIEAKALSRKYDVDKNIINIISQIVSNSKIPKPLKRLISFKRLKSERYKYKIRDSLIQQYVYALNGAFLMMGPLFFDYHNGFDEYTFLYSEEIILAEMLLTYNLKAVYVPDFKVLHKTQKTANYVWNKKAWMMKNKYDRQSVKYWYNNYYRKNIN